MEGETARISLELSLEGESVTGWARNERDGTSRRFDGRLGLLAAIDALIDSEVERGDDAT